MKVRFDQITVNVKEKKKPTEEDRHHYIGLEHLDSGSLTVSRWGADVTPKGEKLLMKKGDVLFGKRRAYQKKVAIAPFDGIFSAHGMVLRPNEEIIDRSFFPLFISSDYFLDAAIALSVGSLSPTINWKDLARLEFTLPPLAKQRELAEVLWAIEDTRTAYQRLEKATEELVKSRFIEMFGDLESNPKGWEKAIFDDVSVKITDGEHVTVPRIPKGYVFLNARNVLKNGNIDLTGVTFISEENHNRIYKRCNPEPGDILLTTTGTIGNVAIVPETEPFSMDRGITLIKQDRNVMNGTFFAVAMRMDSLQMHMKNGIHASAIGHLFMNKVKALPILVPPIALQNQFADFVAQADKSKLAMEKVIEKQTAIEEAVMREWLE